MSASDVAAVIVAVAVAVLCLGAVLALFSVMGTLRQVRAAVEEVRREAVPLVVELRATVSKADAELTRVDGIVENAESISSTVDSASRLAYLFLANPLVKALAFGAGTTRAARRLRRRQQR